MSSKDESKSTTNWNIDQPNPEKKNCPSIPSEFFDTVIPYLAEAQYWLSCIILFIIQFVVKFTKRCKEGRAKSSKTAKISTHLTKLLFAPGIFVITVPEFENNCFNLPEEYLYACSFSIILFFICILGSKKLGDCGALLAMSVYFIFCIFIYGSIFFGGKWAKIENSIMTLNVILDFIADCFQEKTPEIPQPVSV